MNNDHLEHHGIKGMKWGHRKDPYSGYNAKKKNVNSRFSKSPQNGGTPSNSSAASSMPSPTVASKISKALSNEKVQKGLQTYAKVVSTYNRVMSNPAVRTAISVGAAAAAGVTINPQLVAISALGLNKTFNFVTKDLSDKQKKSSMSGG